jgi:predicted DNA-binding protein (MmcQ/YjbR family)
VSRRDTRDYLLSKPEAVCDYPFGPDVEVLKVSEKMFATLAMNEGVLNMNLKCDPHEAVILRDIFPAVLPGYHMNKRHWNTVILDGSIPTGEIERMIDNSYELVVKGLKKVQRQALEIRHTKDILYTKNDSKPLN